MKSHSTLLNIFILVLIPASTLAVKAINDTKKYPVCIDDSDCEKKNLDGHACFQYFCYPWQPKEQQASDPVRPLESCRKDNDCPQMQGGPAKCFRHFERRKVTYGVCVASIDRCDVHDDCYAKGGKCCNGYCCNEDYFQALSEMPCFNDLGCKVRSLFKNSQCAEVLELSLFFFAPLRRDLPSAVSIRH